MPSFAELQQSLNDAKRRQFIAEHLIEYIDENFRAADSEEPKNMLLDDNKIPVPEVALESFVNEVLLPIATECKEEAARIVNLEVPPTAAPVTEEVTVDKKKSKKS